MRWPGAGSIALLCASASATPLGSAAQEAEAVRYEVDGVRVLQRVLDDRDVVSVQISLLGGARQLTEETQGIERFLLEASERGTARYPGEETLNAQVRSGSVYSVTAGPDWSSIRFSGLAEAFDESWDVVVDRLVAPALDSAALHLTRQRILTGLRSRGDSPDEEVRRLAESLAFADHPYRFDVDGTESSIERLDAETLRAYHSEHLVRSRMLVTVVGSVDRARVEAAVSRGLSALPLGAYEWRMPPPWTKPRASIASEERALPTNYVLGYFGGPDTMDDDYLAFEVALTVLSGAINGQIREQGLSYAAGAPLVARASSGGGVYVSTTDPDATFDIVNRTISALKEVTFRRNDLLSYADDSVLEYYLGNQTSAQQASFLTRSFLLHGKLTDAESWVDDMRDVAPSAVRRVFREYVQNIQYGFLGRTYQIPRDKLLRH